MIRGDLPANTRVRTPPGRGLTTVLRANMSDP